MSNFINEVTTTIQVARKKEYVALVGKTPGTLLSQIMFWYAPSKPGVKFPNKLRVYRAGQWWIAKTRAQWMEETGLTLDQYKHAKKTLVDRGFIEVKMMKFTGVTQSHLRILEDNLTAANDMMKKGYQKPLKVVENPSLQQWSIHHSSGGKPTTVDTDITSENTTENTNCFASQNEEQGELNKEVNTSTKEEFSQKPKENLSMATADEQLAKHQAKKDSSYGAAGSKKALSTVWIDFMFTLDPKAKPVLHGKDMGQFKTFKEYVISCDEEPVQVLRYTLQNWGDFNYEVKYRSGYNMPYCPRTINFLMYNRESAVFLYKKYQLQLIAKPVTVEVEKEPVGQIPVFTGNVADPHPYKLEGAEKEAFLAKMKAKKDTY
jgi:hypothetical protein